MDLLQKIRKYENLHIVFWLIKDSCWMLELKWLGAIMMVPTLFLAVYLVIKTLNTPDVYISMAIFFWIMANSYWMMMEFFNDNHYKNLASIPFGLGFIMVALFYLKSYQARRGAVQEQR
jgi:hypothetical protein